MQTQMKPSTVSDTPPAKRSISMVATVDADAELSSYMSNHKISRWWPEVHDKLGITSVAELRYIGKAAVLSYLAGLPALPVLKLAELADTPQV